MFSDAFVAALPQKGTSPTRLCKVKIFKLQLQGAQQLRLSWPAAGKVPQLLLGHLKKAFLHDRSQQDTGYHHLPRTTDLITYREPIASIKGQIVQQKRGNRNGSSMRAGSHRLPQGCSQAYSGAS
ncbi:hypothetical protein WJX77_010919 [Trebouxia sp. C0004]